MKQFLKEHWILLFSIILLALMVLPLLYFGNLFRMLDNVLEVQSDLRSGPVPTVGICLNNLVEGRTMLEKEIFIDEAKKNKVPAEIKVAHYSLTRQKEQIYGLIRDGVKALIIAPVNKNGLAGVLQEAAAKGIKILLYDELTDGPADLYCGMDYRKIGRIQADYLFKKAGRGRYLILYGPSHSYKAVQIGQGQIETIKAMSERGADMFIQSLADWSPEEAALIARTQAMSDKVKAVLAPSDMIIIEIIKLNQKEGINSLYLGGVGGERTLLRRMITNERLATVTSDYASLARAGFQNALKLIAGERLMVSETILSNSRKIPAIYVPVKLINQANVDREIKDPNINLEE